MEDKQRINTPCPACEFRSLFIGAGGHITCGNLKCPNPIPEDVVKDLKERVAELERTPPANSFAEAFNALANAVHANAVQKGFWPDTGRNDGEIIALMHSELSEALEAIRHGNPPDDKVPQFSGYEAELADVIIRIMDAAAGRDLDVAGALLAKVERNRLREYRHGKQF